MLHVHIRDNINGMILFTYKTLEQLGNIVTIHFDSCLNMIPEGRGLICFMLITFRSRLCQVWLN